MSAPKIAVVFYKYKTYSNGTHPILIRITANRKSSYISTGYSVKEEYWDEKNKRLVETRSKEHPERKILSNAKAINTDIELQVSKVIQAKQDISMTEQPQTSIIIKNKISEIRRKDFAFYRLVDNKGDAATRTVASIFNFIFELK